MIYSGLDDIGKAKLIAGKVIQEVCFESMLGIILYLLQQVEWCFYTYSMIINSQ